MRILLLGKLKEQAVAHNLTTVIKSFKRNTKRIFGDDFSSQAIDFLLFTPNQVGDNDGVEFERFDNYCNIYIDPGKQPKNQHILATMLQAATMFYFDLNHKNDFQSEFLLDLVKTGTALKIANAETQVDWFIDELDEQYFQFLYQKARDILSGQEAYDEDFWLDNSGKNPYFVLWFFGEKVVDLICENNNLHWSELTQADLEDFFKINHH